MTTQAIEKPRINTAGLADLEAVLPLRTPFAIRIDPTDTCNLACSFCPTGDLDLMKKTPGRGFGPMRFELFTKIIDDIRLFRDRLKVITLYKEGEPLVNRRFADMVGYAKKSGCTERVETLSNGLLLTPERNEQIIAAGLDRITISVYGTSADEYRRFTKRAVDFKKLTENIADFYRRSRGKCVVHVKLNEDVVSPESVRIFRETFGSIADEIFCEHVLACWPNFSQENHGVTVNPTVDLYGGPIEERLACAYVLYSMQVNSNGTCSACFVDWEHKLIIGDARTESIVGIWNGTALRRHQLMMLRGERKSHPTCGNCDQMRRGRPHNVDPFREMLLAKFVAAQGSAQTQ